MRRVLITGGSGFIGTNVLEYFASQNIPVLNLDIAPPASNAHRPFWRELDILDLPVLASAVDTFCPTDIIHLAARTDIDESARLPDYRVNTDGVANVVHALAGVPTIRSAFFASTMLVCRVGYQPQHETDCCPATVYGRSKVVGERLVRESTLSNWIIGRLTSIWGPWFGEPYRQFFELVRKGLYVSPNHSAATKTFGYVENTVHQIDRLLVAGGSGAHRRIFYLGDQPPIHIPEWAEAIATESGAPKPRRVPLSIFRLAAKFGDIAAIAGVRFPMTSFRLRNMTTDNIINLDSINALASRSEVPLEEGIRRTIRWLDATGQEA